MDPRSFDPSRYQEQMVAARRRLEQALAVGGETYAGVNPHTLCQVVAYVREAGRYPATR